MGEKRVLAAAISSLVCYARKCEKDEFDPRRREREESEEEKEKGK